MFLSLFAALVLQGEQPSITFASPCISTPALMVELSKQSGEPLFVIGEPAKYDQAVRFDHVPLSTVMARLAEVHAGEWVKRGEGFQFQRSSVAMNAEQIRLRKAAIAGIEKKQKESREQLQKMGRLDQKTANMLINKIRDIKVSSDGTPDFSDPIFKNADTFNPGKRTALQLCLSFAPEDLASMEPGTHVVYSTAPNIAERTMPEEAISAISELVESQKNLVQIEKALMEVLSPDSPIPFPGNSARVLLRLSRDLESGAFAFKVNSISDKGQQIEQENESIQPREDPADPIPLSKTRATAEEKQIATTFNPPIQNEMGGPREASPVAPLNGDLRGKLFHIDQFHPGSLVMGPILLREASQEGKNLLVLLNDEAVSAAHTAIASGEKSLQGYRQPVASGDNWIQSYPSDHATSDRIELDKKRFQYFLLAGQDNGSVPLQAQLDLVSQCSEWSLVSNTLASDYRQALLIDGEECFNRVSYLGLLFYGTLTDLQLKQAVNGLKFQAFSDEQKNLLSRMVYGDNSSPIIPIRFFDPTVATDDTTVSADAADYVDGSLPEEVLPNGISFDGSLKLDIGESDTLYFKVKTGLGDQAGCTDSAGLAFYAADKGCTLLSLQPAKQTFFTLQFKLSSAIGTIASFRSNKPSGERVTRIDQLPKSFQDAISESVEATKKMQEDGGNGGFEGPTPPR